MPRTKRFLLSQSFYHIMTRGNNRNTVFKTDEDYQYYLGLVFKYKLEHPFDLYHYCLMPNHTHFLIQTRQALDFSAFMKKLNLAYFHHYRKSYGWVGHFWQDRYRSQAVGKDAYFIQCGKYIELNPVRAGLVENPEDYLYSSHGFYSKGQYNILLTSDFMYQEMGKSDIERQKNYQKLVVDEIIGESYNMNVWGSDRQRYQEVQKINRKKPKT